MAPAETFGLKCWRGTPPAMHQCHCHNDIEFNLVETGAVSYLYGGAQTTVGAGQLAVFWASVPHQIVHREPATTMQWLNLPLSLFLQWQLPATLTHTILQGHVVVESDAVHVPLDLALFSHWREDLRPDVTQHDTAQASHEQVRTALLEIEARLRRLARSLNHGMGDLHRHLAVVPSQSELGKVTRMTRFIAEHYREPISISEIAREVELHPNYAMQLFRKEFGMSVLHYLTRYRVSHAQRLLATTQNEVLSIALTCGFGSVSRFYAVFKQTCGQSPKQYRASVQAPKSVKN